MPMNLFTIGNAAMTPKRPATTAIRKARMIVIALALIDLGIARAAHAGILHTDAQATMTSGFGFSTNYLPIGTVVTASVDFDIAPGVPLLFPQILSAAGTFAWNDVTPQVFNVSGAQMTGAGPNGNIFVSYSGAGPTNASGLFPTEFIIGYNIGTNPFTTHQDLSVLLMNSTIVSFQVGVRNQAFATAYGQLKGDVSGAVGSTVPEPTSLSIFGAVFCAFARRLRGRHGK